MDQATWKNRDTSQFPPAKKGTGYFIEEVIYSAALPLRPRPARAYSSTSSGMSHNRGEGLIRLQQGLQA